MLFRSGTIFTRGTERTKQKVKWGYYLAPGYYVSDESMVYSKVSYIYLKTDPDGNRSPEPNFFSIGYGLGYRYSINQDNLLSVEWMNLPTGKKSFSNFKNGAEISPNMSILSVGWAKKF